MRPARVTLKGEWAALVPLDAAAHGEDLWTALAGQDHLWRYLWDGPYADRESFVKAVEVKASSPDAIFFAILVSGRALGYASLMRIDEANRVVEVGNILYSPALRRTTAATEAMYLLACYVFDELGYRRYEWKCDFRNEPSRAAALRLGFQFEGLFRQHMIVKGENRDTAWYSMLDGEWPARRAAFEKWLAKENFDAAGRQLSPLRLD